MTLHKKETRPERGDEWMVCPDCEGNGKPASDKMKNGKYQMTETCQGCEGQGGWGI